MKITYYRRSIFGGEITGVTQTELSMGEMHERAPKDAYYDPNPPLAVLEQWRLKKAG